MKSISRAFSSRAHLVAILALATCGSVQAQLRVVNWNVSNYADTSLTGGTNNRTDALRTAIYGVFQTRSMAPDVILGEEFTSQSAVNNFVNVLNGATNSPGDWAAGTFVDGVDTDSAFFYRMSKVTFVQNKTVFTSTGSTSDQPRNTQRFDITLKGYTGSAPALSMYGVHLKSGSASSDNQRRLLETQRIRADAQNTLAGANFLIGGDFNTQSSSQSAYQELVGSKSNNAGRFTDPIATPGDWNNDSSFKFVHTQDPVLGMDDRHDQLLLGPSLVDGKGFDYVGSVGTPYSTTTWNDPNHSYRAWGNDGGQSLNSPIRTTNNAMVGPTIAQALKDSSTASGGHLPVFLDLRVPGELATDTSSIDFGTVTPGQNPEQRAIQISNDVNLAVWGSASAVDALRYTLVVLGGDFSAPGGTFTDPAGGGSITNQITLTDTTPGPKTGQLEIFVDDVLTRTIPLNATVVPEPALVAVAGLAVGFTFRRRQRR